MVLHIAMKVQKIFQNHWKMGHHTVEMEQHYRNRCDQHWVRELHLQRMEFRSLLTVD